MVEDLQNFGSCNARLEYSSKQMARVFLSKETLKFLPVFMDHVMYVCVYYTGCTLPSHPFSSGIRVLATMCTQLIA